MVVAGQVVQYRNLRKFLYLSILLRPNCSIKANSLVKHPSKNQPIHQKSKQEALSTTQKSTYACGFLFTQKKSVEIDEPYPSTVSWLNYQSQWLLIESPFYLVKNPRFRWLNLFFYCFAVNSAYENFTPTEVSILKINWQSPYFHSWTAVNQL